MRNPLYLALNKDGKQLGLFDTNEHALAVKDASEAEIWDYDAKTGRYYPTGNKVCKFEILPKEGE